MTKEDLLKNIRRFQQRQINPHNLLDQNIKRRKGIIIPMKDDPFLIFKN